jgi:hypothetical protein
MGKRNPLSRGDLEILLLYIKGLKSFRIFLNSRTGNGRSSSSDNEISVQRSRVLTISLRTFTATEEKKKTTPHSK